MKIFITGFMRSGTTLLRDLIEKHPDVKKMFHERGIISVSKKDLYKAKVLPDVRFINRQSIKKNKKVKGIKKTQFRVNFSLRKDNWGEKIPYYERYITKGRFRGGIIKYCNRWNSYFKNDSVIIHIVRHPIDVAISSVRRGFSISHKKCLIHYFRSVPFVIKNTKRYRNLLTIKYEDLVLNPEDTLKIIFLHCGLNSNQKIIKDIINRKDIFFYGKMKKSRAFSYKKREQNIKINKLLERLLLRMIDVLNNYGKSIYEYNKTPIQYYGLKKIVIMEMLDEK